jgi:hypothetical protein
MTHHLTAEQADWIRTTVLPPLWRTDDAIDELRTCYCQAPPSDWLDGIAEVGRLWDRNGRNVAENRVLIQVWHADRTCRRIHRPTEETSR